MGGGGEDRLVSLAAALGLPSLPLDWEPRGRKDAEGLISALRVSHTLPDPLCSEVPGGWGAVAAAPGRVDLGRAHRREALGGGRERGAPSLLRRHRHRHRPSGGPAPARPPEALGSLSLPLPRALEALMAAVGPRTPHYPRQSFSDLPSPRGLFPGRLLAVPLE